MLRFTLERLIAAPAIWWIESGDLIARFDRLPDFVQGAVSAEYIGHWQLSEPTQQSVAGFAIERIVDSVAYWYTYHMTMAKLEILLSAEGLTPRWFRRRFKKWN